MEEEEEDSDPGPSPKSQVPGSRFRFQVQLSKSKSAKSGVYFLPIIEAIARLTAPLHTHTQTAHTHTHMHYNAFSKCTVRKVCQNNTNNIGMSEVHT